MIALVGSCQNMEGPNASSFFLMNRNVHTVEKKKLLGVGFYVMEGWDSSPFLWTCWDTASGLVMGILLVLSSGIYYTFVGVMA